MDSMAMLETSPEDCRMTHMLNPSSPDTTGLMWTQTVFSFYVSPFHITYFILFLFSGVPQRLDAGDLGRPTRYCYLESIYHTWDGGTDHRAVSYTHLTLPTTPYV